MYDEVNLDFYVNQYRLILDEYSARMEGGIVMVFVKWIGIVVVSVALVYLSLWLGGGWGELLVSASPLRVKLMEVVLSAAGAVAALLVASEMDDHIEFFEDWLFAEVILVIVTFVFGAVTDPLVTYGLWPWQWMTWWAVLPLLFAILTFHRFYLAFRHDLEFRRYLASEGLWREWWR